jgi:MerR family transcriptional regulator, copper efflux regulator
MTIGQLAHELDLNARTIRYYEHVGVLPEPERTTSGYRLYTHEDEERLRFVKSAQRVGLTLGEIRETLAFRDRGQAPCHYVAEIIEQRLAETNQRIRELRTFKRELSELSELSRRMRAGDVVERDSRYCHYIASSGSSESQQY